MRLKKNMKGGGGQLKKMSSLGGGHILKGIADVDVSSYHPIC